jgi:hypothetical protein
MRLVFFILFISVGNILSAQDGLYGRVLNSLDHTPIPGVNISFAQSSLTSQTGEDGSFNLSSYHLNQEDTITFSSVGFQSVKIPVKRANDLRMFYLPLANKVLNTVTVTSYLNSGSEGALATDAAFFRNWTSNKNGREIGRLLYIHSDNYKIEKVRIKINNQCDTCVLRMRIRGLKNGLPDYELLHDSVSVVAGQYDFNGKFLDVDLRHLNVIIKKHRQVYVGFETLYCNNKKDKTCSLCYIGTEEGSYFYRTKNYEDWHISDESNIYMKIFYRF